MSTRCQIGFYEQDNDNLLKPAALLYRHSDGYPGTVSGSKYGVLPDLIPFLKAFHKRRGLDDTEYAAAWTMHHLIDHHVKLIKELRANAESNKDYFPEDGKDFLGHGICKDFHGDIEYYYAVQGTTVNVFEVHWPVEDKEPKEGHFTLLKTVQLVPKKRSTACATT
jgi:hypothetical protein